MLFYSMFKTLVGKEIAVELKNDARSRGGTKRRGAAPSRCGFFRAPRGG